MDERHSARPAADISSGRDLHTKTLSATLSEPSLSTTPVTTGWRHEISVASPALRPPTSFQFAPGFLRCLSIVDTIRVTAESLHHSAGAACTHRASQSPGTLVSINPMEERMRIRYFVNHC